MKLSEVNSSNQHKAINGYEKRTAKDPTSGSAKLRMYGCLSNIPKYPITFMVNLVNVQLSHEPQPAVYLPSTPVCIQAQLSVHERSPDSFIKPFLKEPL